MAIYLAPLQSFLQKTLNGAINDTQTTITLSSTTNLQAPGTIVIDRVDSSGNTTAALREIIAYAGIAGNDITGCTRGFDGSTAQSHGDGAICETTLTAQGFASLVTVISTFADSNGYIKAIPSPVSIARGDFIQIDVTSIASIAQLNISSRIDVSAASVTGIGLFPTFTVIGAISGATTAPAGILVVPKTVNFSWFSVITRSVASGASVVFDFMKNGTSIFAGVTKPTIVGGGTYVSTASINTKNFVPGDVLRFDVNSNTVGLITDVTGQGRAD